MKKSYFSDAATVSITLPDGAVVGPIGTIEYAKITTDYYTLCASLEHDPRLRRDFLNKEQKWADACLIVWHVDEFAARLAAGVAPKLPTRPFSHLPINYYDALRFDQKQFPSVPFSKDLRFAYQREYRFVWNEPPDACLEEFFVEIGTLNDIATLITSDGVFIAGRPLT